MKHLLWFLAVLGLTASVASAGPNAGGVLWVHDTGVIRPGPIVWPGDPDGAGCPTSVDNEVDADAVVRYWKVYAAFPAGSSPRLSTVAWKTEFTTVDASPSSYVYVEGGSVCNGETPTTVFFLGGDGFPGANGGTIGQAFPNNTRTTLVTPLFMFWGYGYNADPATYPSPTWRLGPKVNDDNFGDDNTPTANVDKIAGYGVLGFGQAGVTPCPTGGSLSACCTATPGGQDLAGCALTTQADCAAPGVWHGTQYVCDPDPCPIPTGACCTSSGICSSTLVAKTVCEAAGGTYMGNSVTCDPMPCQAPAGACCFPDGTCEVQSQTECTGDWALSGTCVPNTCPAPDVEGACCTLAGGCDLTTQADCVEPGQWHAGPCDPNPCPTPTGACCTPEQLCTLTILVDCALPSTWSSEFTACVPNPCSHASPTERASWGQIKNRFR